jgi:hypothetical protein
MKSIDIEVIRDLVSYDETSGVLRWLPRPASYFPCNSRGGQKGAMKRWNGQFAGKVAGCLNKGTGYIYVYLLGSSFGAHRLIFALAHGRWPADQIDHVNGVRHDNRVRNLREVSALQNARNRACPASNPSGMIGVRWYPKQRRWRAGIKVGGVPKHLGWFDNFEDAKSARQAASAALGFHENHGRRSNYPQTKTRDWRAGSDSSTEQKGA